MIQPGISSKWGRRRRIINTKKEWLIWENSWSVAKGKRIRKLIRVSLYQWFRRMYGTQWSITLLPIEPSIWSRCLIGSNQIKMMFSLHKRVMATNRRYIHSNIVWTTGESRKWRLRMEKCIKWVLSSRLQTAVSRRWGISSLSLLMTDMRNGRSRIKYHNWIQEINSHSLSTLYRKWINYQNWIIK